MNLGNISENFLYHGNATYFKEWDRDMEVNKYEYGQ